MGFNSAFKGLNTEWLADIDGNRLVKNRNRQGAAGRGDLSLTRFGKQRLYADSVEVRAECSFMRFGLRGSLIQ